MTAEFCAEFFEECSGADQLNLNEGYCEYHATQTEDGHDQYWSYPLVIEREGVEEHRVWERVLQGRSDLNPTRLHIYLIHSLRVAKVTLSALLYRTCGCHFYTRVPHKIQRRSHQGFCSLQEGEGFTRGLLAPVSLRNASYINEPGVEC